MSQTPDSKRSQEESGDARAGANPPSPAPTGSGAERSRHLIPGSAWLTKPAWTKPVRKGRPR